MKKVKALIVMTALVAVIAIAGVAQAAVTTVTGTVDTSTVGITLCNGTFSTADETLQGTGTCSAGYTSSDLQGYTMKYRSAVATLDSANASNSIAALPEGASAVCGRDVDCFSFKFDTNDAIGETWAQSNAQDYNVGEHAVPTTVAPGELLMTGADPLISGTYTFTYYVDVNNLTPAADDYTSVGAITITAV